MEWNNSHKNPPTEGQKVYYFGQDIGIGIGHYNYKENSVYGIELCPHLFKNVDWGLVDERAKSWCPIIPEKYTQGLYD